MGRGGMKAQKGIRMCYVDIPASHMEYKHYLLQKRVKESKRKTRGGSRDTWRGKAGKGREVKETSKISH